MKTRRRVLTLAARGLAGMFGLRPAAIEAAEQNTDKDAALDAAVRNNVFHQTRLLTEKSKIIRGFAENSRVKIVPAVYDLKTGVVDWPQLPKGK